MGGIGIFAIFLPIVAEPAPAETLAISSERSKR
ncbi:hypothetical protein BMS3Abin02_01163 [bacterium BMS3Abin02]|nr:hypothetical protein BMS3Abin02_01163 [bacterium BMS3Abin02]GBE22201.1 hypothetical protein BMS3Bbin01_01564 [bacterium BMS3Bbin01]